VTLVQNVYMSVVFLQIFGVYIRLILISSGSQMSTPSFFIGYTDGVSHSTRHLASAVWDLYNSDGELFASSGICLGQATNNIVEYSAIVKLLTEAISLNIWHLIVRLDSQLIVRQLENHYAIRSSTLLRLYMRVRLLERSFDYIEYQHIPRRLNTYIDTLENLVLDIHLRHLN